MDEFVEFIEFIELKVERKETVRPKALIMRSGKYQVKRRRKLNEK